MKNLFKTAKEWATKRPVVKKAAVIIAFSFAALPLSGCYVVQHDPNQPAYPYEPPYQNEPLPDVRTYRVCDDYRCKDITVMGPPTRDEMYYRHGVFPPRRHDHDHDRHDGPRRGKDYRDGHRYEKHDRR